jgi:hypothetical protein
MLLVDALIKVVLKYMQTSLFYSRGCSSFQKKKKTEAVHLLHLMACRLIGMILHAVYSSKRAATLTHNFPHPNPHNLMWHSTSVFFLFFFLFSFQAHKEDRCPEPPTPNHPAPPPRNTNRPPRNTPAQPPPRQSPPSVHFRPSIHFRTP